ncbi:sensor histidine kinase [Thiorhodococcus minor]|uniref:histidine kinase n=1 Tax=Thiorhodococcus minor TaxID=57489 RepID=A0A6M0K2H7_9GAMM|nr:HAMP domain-containing sensor histidine kinase [Thiorhodococcus minor]NEV62777.1 HAMP domain-containing histidine kinase [Thiorhodococcus minor]
MSLTPASYRHRLPLSLSVAAVVTAVSMALALGLQTLDNLREDQGRNALRLGHAMSEILVQALLHDDVWLAYSLLRGPEKDAADATWILIDAGQRIFASNRPERFRLDQSLEAALPWLPVAAFSPDAPAPALVRSIEPQDDGTRRVLRLTLASEGGPVGELIALLSDRPFLARFREILVGGVLVTAAVLAVLLPAGWLWGRRMASPLMQLAACMARVGTEDARQLRCKIPESDSEIGQLGRQFSAMLAALAEKDALEQQMLQAERLAAVGRVAAGVAHEVNNPLGGMLMAIDTYRQGQVLDARTARLLDLIDRALQQIRGSVSALLVEARGDSRSLAPTDLDDVRTLIQPKLARSSVNVAWSIGLVSAVDLPAAPVRQLLLNLFLNAIEAAEPGGAVRVEVGTEGAHLAVRVENSGRPIPAEQLAHLFEPYPEQRPHAQGLGLWICYQIASQLGGRIQVASSAERTCFQVALPLGTEEVS